MKNPSSVYDTLRQFVETVPLADGHDHSIALPKPGEGADPVGFFTKGYMASDLQSASSDAEIAVIMDPARPLEERYPPLERAWRRTRHTGYGRTVRLALREFYGEDDLSLEALDRMRGRMLDLSDRAVYESVLDRAGIAVRLEDVWPDTRKVLDGTWEMTPRGRLMVSLPGFHGITTRGEVDRIGHAVSRSVTSLEEYEQACRDIFEGYRRYGAAGFKDQTAYGRDIGYGNPTRHEAEAAFNRMMADPRRTLGHPDEARPLNDYLFHQFMRMARDLDMPVQIHTGHMAGIRNEIRKTNAVLLTPVLELHRETRFDLFHANWPYGGEFLFLGKNYPNVTLNFCWANIIDPVYCRRLFQQALSCVPHGKIHAYGSDLGADAQDHAWAHARITRENVALALAGMVETGDLDLDEARHVASAWLFDNLNENFRLGLTR